MTNFSASAYNRAKLEVKLTGGRVECSFMPKELPLSFHSQYNSGGRLIEEVTMKVREMLRKTRSIRIPEEGYPVEMTVAEELLNSIESGATIQHTDKSGMKSGASFR